MSDPAKPAPTDAELPPLALHLLQTSYADYRATTTSLIARLTEQNRELRATLILIRADLAGLLQESALPAPWRFGDAAYPRHDQVTELAERIRAEEEGAQ